MPRTSNQGAKLNKRTERLTALVVDRAKPAPGAKRAKVMPDGRGLYLHITPAGSKSWLLRYWLDGSEHWMGLGSFPETTLAGARDKALAARRLRQDGTDPLAERAAKKVQKAADAAKAKDEATTFQQAAEACIESKRSGWRNAVHAEQWTATLKTYAYPVIGDKPVSAIETTHVLQILQADALWTTKTETASRVRGRIETVLDYAKVSGWRSGENVARWKGHLDHILPAPTKVKRVAHHAAVDWREMAQFLARVAEQPGMAALALRFAVLTATRTDTVIGARWSEIDMDAALWTIAGNTRTKNAQELRVPLSPAALDVLCAAEATAGQKDIYVFPTPGADKSMSNGAMLALLKRMDVAATVHGTARAAFRTWAGESGKPADIAEAALNHTQRKLDAAYQRGDLLDRRRILMGAWATHCTLATGAKVVPIRAA